MASVRRMARTAESRIMYRRHGVTISGMSDSDSQARLHLYPMGLRQSRGNFSQSWSHNVMIFMGSVISFVHVMSPRGQACSVG